MVLDGVEDPHNLGAIIRTAHAAGAGGVVIPERRAAGLTDVVGQGGGRRAGIPAGGARHQHQPHARRAERARLSGSTAWTSAAPRITTGWSTTRPTVLVLGGEGKGLHEQVRKHCDVLVRIPMAGKISSLNVSVAAGVVLFEWKTAALAAQHSKIEVLCADIACACCWLAASAPRVGARSRCARGTAWW